ncbi:Lacal_2735 family protein [Thalassobellus suaedae]|uniref:Lacal_2735 family protein n=1 Tax=Thalassobellus suaedae TaxID=3074124 RepID=A0ABY9Y0N4_9FLAO|nr:Lacal_2735 family protein [Flavobacteriaceae bacterium HL-DH14]WNH11764.1 Lacal_2735 family protein [Flavobacteriaceae bacterium HL-DH10]|tara:strand:- start:165 stop:332 length:168 start_codon:yes stop_codon:yes gene_type:complete
MFGLFKKKTELEKLQDTYKSLMAEWHKLSSINRAESDKKYAEAEAISKQIEILKQ